ncbi:hypothetical protein [Actinoplanes sp. L3-i22]|uniref:hypothetical protein n=1 Tax=Actinoplanes sp. L3-i22 TaxID=2836373 RepID=UPI001C77DE1F|nr:hypothetical protein [Actinoplanes sp. L3-i22]BCY12441.1 hypothetical protein L3i22_075290 [Actinoplanes sp. L3-i22]
MLRSRLARIRSLQANLSLWAEDDPRTQETRLRLARVYQDHQDGDTDRERWDELAAIEIERVIESRTRTLGPDHPATLEARRLAPHDLNRKPAEENPQP